MTTATGFFLKKGINGERDIRRSPIGNTTSTTGVTTPGANANGSHGGVPGTSSTTFTKGDALKFTNGLLIQCGSTDNAQYICDAPLGNPVITGATDETVIPVIKVDQLIFEVAITPLVNAAACVSNSSTTTIILPLSAGTPNDLIGGLVYSIATDEVRVITANTYSGGNVTITVNKPFSRAITTGDTGSLVPYGYGSNAVKMNTSGNGLLNTIGGATGGKVGIYGVNLKKKNAEVYFISGD